MADESAAAPSAGEQVVNALKFLADDRILPGASQLVQGNVSSGVLYGLAGIGSRALLGPLGWLPWLVAGLDSFSMSVSNKHLLGHFFPPMPQASTPAPPSSQPPTQP